MAVTHHHRAFAPAPGLGQRMAQGLAAQAALLCLLLALVVVPTLGRLHQVSHGSALDRAHAGRLLTPALAQTAQARAGAPTDTIHSLLDVLVAKHTPAECLLLDQLALGTALHMAAVVLPTLAPAEAKPAQPAERVGVLHVALFQARGPPKV